jgi:hypothetical protein
VDFVPLLAALAFAWKLVDWTKQIRVKDINAVVTQAAVWVAGVFVVFLLAQSDFGHAIRIAGGIPLDQLNFWSLLLVGLTVGSSASVGYDFRRSFDNSDSAAQPSLVTGEIPVVPPVVTVDADSGSRAGGY